MNGVVELQDIAEDVTAAYGTRKWHFSATVRGRSHRYIGTATACDPDFLVAATKLICEAKRMREAAR